MAIKDNNNNTSHSTQYENNETEYNKQVEQGHSKMMFKVKMAQKLLSQVKIRVDALDGVTLSRVTKVNPCEVSTPTYCMDFPRSINDLDKCNHLVLRFQPEISQDHPGFADTSYRARRDEITNIAFQYKHGQPIPRVTYIPEEIDTWRHSYQKLKDLYDSRAFSLHIESLNSLELAGVYSPNFIPQLDDVSKYLKTRSGFQLRPAAGLLSARDFLASLAFRVFQCTQFLRHHSMPDHSPEPDCIHELLGHIPMLANPEFAEFSQEIGLSSLGACDEDIEKLATCYWFMVEFGLCKEGKALKAIGAGLLSSFGELQYALSDGPKQLPFEPETVSVTSYSDEHYQPQYFVAESIDDMKEKMRTFSRTIRRPFHLRYDPYTQSIQSLDNRTSVSHLFRLLKQETSNMERALEKQHLEGML